MNVTSPSILKPVSAIVIPAPTPNRFIANQSYVINTERNARALIIYLSHNFKAWFLDGDGKTEDPLTERTLHYHKLQRSSTDDLIITELGGAAKVEATLWEIFFLMERQKHGEVGVLLNNGSANLFYIRDITGVLRSVRMRWYGDGWRFFTEPVNKATHACGYQVFS